MSSTLPLVKSKVKENLEWEFGLFDCFKNPMMCIWALCIPFGGDCMQAAIAQTAEPDNKNAACVACFCSVAFCCYGGVYNTHRLAKNLGLKDNICLSLLTSIFCDSCGTTQEWMETMKRVKGSHTITFADYSRERRNK